MLKVTPQITIPDNELEERFIQASGPGGQNVNKVATAVQLRFDPSTSRALPPEVSKRLMITAGLVKANGTLVITARRFRTQEANRRDARVRLSLLIMRATQSPRKRHLTRPTRSSHERRLQDKAKRSSLKRQRTEQLYEDK